MELEDPFIHLGSILKLSISNKLVIPMFSALFIVAECAKQISLILHEQNFVGPYSCKSIQFLNLFQTNLVLAFHIQVHMLLSRYSIQCFVDFFICLVLQCNLRSLGQKEKEMREGNYLLISWWMKETRNKKGLVMLKRVHLKNLRYFKIVYHTCLIIFSWQY